MNQLRHNIKKILRDLIKEQSEMLTPNPPADVVRVQSFLKKSGYKLGNTGPNNDGVDGVIGKRTKNAFVNFKVKNGLTPDLTLDKKTANLMGLSVPLKDWKTIPGNLSTISSVSPSKSSDKDVKKMAKSLGYQMPCVGLDKKSCNKISSSGIVNHGSSGEQECAQYVKKCLSEYDKMYVGNAWFAAKTNKEGRGGNEKYNLFQNGINWPEVYSKIRKLKWTKKDCLNNFGAKETDTKVNNQRAKDFLNTIKSAIPQSSQVSTNSLEPGDLVGLVHDATTNFGFAFCQRMIEDLKLDDNGKFENKPIEYNTHIGFVTTIKDGVPIIAHNVGGTYYTAPVTKMLKRGNDMVSWVITDPQISKTTMFKYQIPPSSISPYS